MVIVAAELLKVTPNKCFDPICIVKLIAATLFGFYRNDIPENDHFVISDFIVNFCRELMIW